MTRHFLTLLDFSPDELARLIERGIEHKRMRASGTIYEPLRGRTLAMVFDLSSTRTRVAFEAGMHQLGGHAIFLSPNDTQLGRGEPIEDTARVLSEMVDIIMLRTRHHDGCETFARAARVPVINAMSARSHPCQLLADIQTFVECRGPIQDKTVAFVGDGYNMCNSYIDASATVRVRPEDRVPQGLRARSGIACNHQPGAAGRDAAGSGKRRRSRRHRRLVVDGTRSGSAERRRQFVGYQVDKWLLDLAKPDALFMHCLPAHRGEEVATTCSTIHARSYGPKRAIACTHRRHCWSFSARGKAERSDQLQVGE